MRYEYYIKDQQGKEEVIKGMSFKKLLKQLNNKYDPNTILQVKYINKKDHELLKYIKTKKVDWFNLIGWIVAILTSTTPRLPSHYKQRI